RLVISGHILIPKTIFKRSSISKRRSRRSRVRSNPKIRLFSPSPTNSRKQNAIAQGCEGTDDSRKDNTRSRSSSSVTTTVSSQLKLKDILAYAHKISYTTFAPPEFASQLYTFADLDSGLPKTVKNIEKKVEALIEPPPPESMMNLSAIQNLLPPNIEVPSGWKPGMPVELPPAPRALEQQQMRPPPGLHRPPDVIQVRAVQLDILESDNSSDDASSDDEE
ncbi:unnamed protein product, partial [Brassica rapa]